MSIVGTLSREHAGEVADDTKNASVPPRLFVCFPSRWFQEFAPGRRGPIPPRHICRPREPELPPIRVRAKKRERGPHRRPSPGRGQTADRRGQPASPAHFRHRDGAHSGGTNQTPPVAPRGNSEDQVGRSVPPETEDVNSSAGTSGTTVRDWKDCNHEAQCGGRSRCRG